MSAHPCILAAAIGLTVVACDETPQEPSSRSAAADSVRQPAAEQPASAQVEPSPPKGDSHSLVWDAPDDWVKQPTRSRMRQATYRVSKAEGDTEDAELVVYYFGPGGGGGVDANMDRWQKQFSAVPDGGIQRSERSAHGMKQHVLSIEKGTFSSGMPRGPKTPKEGYGLMAAIVESPEGPYFFKMTGPAATVKAEREAFVKLLDSVRIPSR